MVIVCVQRYEKKQDCWKGTAIFLPWNENLWLRCGVFGGCRGRGLIAKRQRVCFWGVRGGSR